MEDEKDFKDFAAFKKSITKYDVKGRTAKVRNSWGIYDAYKLLRKNNWLDIGRPLKEHEFYSIIRGVNNLIAEELGKGNKIVLPSKMGSLELRKHQPSARYVDGKLRITYPVDWDSTLKLWYTDPEAKRNKTLVRHNTGAVYRMRYNKFNADYNNKSFYEFTLNNKIKQSLKKNIINGKVDTAYEW